MLNLKSPDIITRPRHQFTVRSRGPNETVITAGVVIWGLPDVTSISSDISTLVDRLTDS